MINVLSYKLKQMNNSKPLINESNELVIESKNLVNDYTPLNTEYKQLDNEYKPAVNDGQSANEYKLVVTKYKGLGNENKGLGNENKGLGNRSKQLMDKSKQLMDKSKQLDNAYKILGKKYKQLVSEYKPLVNEYGDYIFDLRGIGVEEIDLRKFPTNKPVIIKTAGRCVEAGDYKFMLVDRNVYFYTNTKTLTFFPYLYGGQIISIQAIIIVNGKYIVGVKDITKRYFTVVNGQRQKDESVENCVIREITEETGIKATEIQSMIQTSVKTYIKKQYYHDFRAKSYCFKVDAKLDENKCSKVQLRKTQEIGKVNFVRINKFLQIQVPHWSPQSLFLIQNSLKYKLIPHQSQTIRSNIHTMIPIVNNKYVLGIKTKNKNLFEIIYVTQQTDETIESCLLHEIRNQTNLIDHEIFSIIELAPENNTNLFKVHITLTKKRLLRLQGTKTTDSSVLMFLGLTEFSDTESKALIYWSPSTIQTIQKFANILKL